MVKGSVRYPGLEEGKDGSRRVGPWSDVGVESPWGQVVRRTRVVGEKICMGLYRRQEYIQLPKVSILQNRKISFP